MTHLDLTEEEAAALLKELDGLIDGDRYFLSPRIKTLSHSGQAPTVPGSRAATAAAQALCATAGDCTAETESGAVNTCLRAWLLLSKRYLDPPHHTACPGCAIA